MKELYKEDADMLDLLNKIGEVGVEYPKLFKQIWESTYTVVWFGILLMMKFIICGLMNECIGVGLEFLESDIGGNEW